MSNNSDQFGLDLRLLGGQEADFLFRVKELASELYELYRGSGYSAEIEDAKARLEEAAMWATKHIALHGIPDSVNN